MRMHHIGIIVEDICAAKELYEALGYKSSGEIITDTVQNNRLLFVENKMSGEVIELIEPMGGSSVKGLKKGYAHICYETGDLDECIKRFKEKKLGVVFIDKINAPAFGNRRVAFAMLKNKTLIEFLESDKL